MIVVLLIVGVLVPCAHGIVIPWIMITPNTSSPIAVISARRPGCSASSPAAQLISSETVT
jgi:hypothetical protein